MTAKQKVHVYGSIIILIMVGILFLIKGIPMKNSAMICIGIILLLLGGVRGFLFKSLIGKHEDE